MRAGLASVAPQAVGVAYSLQACSSLTLAMQHSVTSAPNSKPTASCGLCPVQAAPTTASSFGSGAWAWTRPRAPSSWASTTRGERPGAQPGDLGLLGVCLAIAVKRFMPMLLCKKARAAGPRRLAASQAPSKASTHRRDLPAVARTLQMTDDVLCVRVSPNGKLLAASLLDSTVRVRSRDTDHSACYHVSWSVVARPACSRRSRHQPVVEHLSHVMHASVCYICLPTLFLSSCCALQVFFVDSLKFFLSLYGHKLPVLSMDISSGGEAGQLKWQPKRCSCRSRGPAWAGICMMPALGLGCTALHPPTLDHL